MYLFCLEFPNHDTEYKDHAGVKCRQSHVFSSLYPTVPLLIAFAHLYTVHHRLRQSSLEPLDCLVFAGVVKYIAMPAVFLMFTQRRHKQSREIHANCTLSSLFQHFSISLLMLQHKC